MEKKIKISLTEKAADVLHSQGITPEQYGPAYLGESVGLDLYNVGPEVSVYGRNKWIVFEEQKVLISTGVKISLPPQTVGIIKERGSITDYSLFARGGVIDPGYTGEIFVNLVNIGENDIKIQTGAKLPVQLIVVPCLNNYEVVSNLEFLEETKDSKRKEKSQGSTNSDNSVSP